MTRTRYGLAIRGDAIAVVRVARTGTAVEICRERDPDASWVETLSGVLATATERAHGVRPIRVVVADRRCREGALFGEDLTQPREEVSARLVAQPGAYFAGSPSGWRAGPVVAAGTGWRGVVLDAALAEAIERAVATAGVELMSVSPEGDESAPLEELARTAAGGGERGELSLDLAGPARRGRRRVVRWGILASAATIALAWAAIAPVWRTAQSTRRMEQEWRSLESAAATVSRIAGEPSWSAAARDELVRLAAHRGRTSTLLAAIARALPDSTAIIALRIDDSGGSVTLVGVGVPQVLPQLARIPELADLRIEGAVTRDIHDGVELQRAALVWSRAIRSTTEPPQRVAQR